LANFAFELLRKTFECEYKIAISDWVIFELTKNGIPEEKIDELLEDLKKADKLVIVERNDENVKEAMKYTQWKDALHAVLAKKCNSVYLVTRNVNDFPDLVELKFPENL